ncbi:MAG: acyltransferase [Kineothrix sp.]
MEKKEKKIYYLDVLRAAAALAVVMLHLASVNWFGYIGSFNWVVFTVVGGFMRFSVPVFFMMSGALFLRREKEVSIRRIYTVYIFRLVVFLVFWAMVYQMYHLLAGQTEGNIFLAAVKNIVKGDTQVHLWFVYAIIGLYLLVPVLKVFTDHADKKQLLYAILLGFLATDIFPLLSRSSGTAAGILVSNYSRLCIYGMGSYVCFFLLGHYLHTYEISKRSRLLLYASGILGVGVIILKTLYLCIRDNTFHETYFSFVMPMMPSVILWSAAVFVFCKYTFVKEGRLAGLTKWLSGISLGIYGIHMLVIFVLQQLGLSTLSFNALLSLPVLFIAVTVISAGAAGLLKRIPVLGKYVC